MWHTYLREVSAVRSSGAVEPRGLLVMADCVVDSAGVAVQAGSEVHQVAPRVFESHCRFLFFVFQLRETDEV